MDSLASFKHRIRVYTLASQHRFYALVYLFFVVQVDIVALYRLILLVCEVMGVHFLELRDKGCEFT